mgnify:CR=1 FL=1
MKYRAVALLSLALLASPLAAQAQQPGMPVVGFLQRQSGFR